MSAESDNIRESLVDQLSSFETRLENKIDDAQMLAEIQEGIGRLLSDNGKPGTASVSRIATSEAAVVNRDMVLSSYSTR